MVFSSYEFIFIFLPITLIIFYMLKKFNHVQSAKLFLVLASLFFYAFWKVEYVLILLLSMSVNFYLANLILLNRGGVKLLFYSGVLFNLALLSFFKYTDFLLENFNVFFQIVQLDFNIPLPHILLPLAISFFTFQQIAFLVDCYKRTNIEGLKSENTYKINILDYALFITFFPQLIAGPIVHHKEMMPQFKSMLWNNSILINWENIAKGLFIFSMGLFKKVYIADSFALWANAGFKIVENGGTLNIFEAWATSLSYTFQLYFDFSGYCDMAIGIALFFSIKLPINFNSPYKALSISDFWRRWHITLGKFLKDYLYIPLGGNRVSKIINLRNLFIVAFVSGVWHGAGWGFVIWGVLHGLAMVLHRIYSFITTNAKFKESIIYKIFAWFVTFNFINLAWIFFRSENLQGAINLLKAMFGITWMELPIKWHRMKESLAQISGSNETLIYIIVCMILCIGFKNSIEKLENFKASYINSLLVMLFLYIALITLGVVPYTEFIYFNF
ncbi:MBOAT family protein [Campylobacter sp. RKI_CA19_01128]|uniref:MBOAT family O-acyltransferase n=1 Tax=unclassified Campylobacter TaxID=2593542 RepID=UPI0021E7A934|nr:MULTISPECIES: MBOAT family O-acyltransferase [unclassified Campylobacter]MCV3348828.1 MBOAT family protein [Campylobacter sp. RKI_CA19_01127]MCV3354885.1 MBOAT family protein [Campylobacter sp. RKI_CA19_01128]